MRQRTTKKKSAARTKQPTTTTRPPQMTITLRLADDVAPVVDQIAVLAQTDPAIVVNVLLAMLIVTRTKDVSDTDVEETPPSPPAPPAEEEVNTDHGVAGA